MVVVSVLRPSGLKYFMGGRRSSFSRLGLATEWIEITRTRIGMIWKSSLGLATEWIEMPN